MRIESMARVSVCLKEEGWVGDEGDEQWKKSEEEISR